jgi:hypothetical protein
MIDYQSVLQNRCRSSLSSSAAGDSRMGFAAKGLAFLRFQSPPCKGKCTADIALPLLATSASKSYPLPDSMLSKYFPTA